MVYRGIKAIKNRKIYIVLLVSNNMANAKEIERGAVSLGAAYGARVAGGIGATGALIGDGKGYTGKVGDGITALPDIVTYFPDMLKDADRVNRISHGIHEAAKSKTAFLKAQELLEGAYQAVQKMAVGVETGVRRTAHYAGEAAGDIAKSGVNAAGKLLEGIGGMFKKGFEGDLEGVLDNGYKGIDQAAKEALKGLDTDSARRAYKAAEGTIDAVVDGSANAMLKVEQAVNTGYNGLQQVQKGLEKVAKVMAEVDYNGILQALEQTGNNIAHQPGYTLAAIATMLAAGEVSARGIRLWGRRGQGSVLDELERKYGKAVFGKQNEGELEIEKFGPKELVKGGLAHITNALAIGAGYVGAAGAALSNGKGYLAKVADAVKAPVQAWNYKGQIGEDASNLANAASELAKTPEKFEALKGKISLMDFKGSYHALQDAMTQIGHTIDYASTIHGNKIWEALGNFTDNVVEQPGKTAMVMATAIGAGYAVARGIKFALTNGEGTIADRLERRFGKNIFPTFWKRKLAKENSQ